MGVLMPATVGELGTPAEDGVLAFVTLPSGHKEPLWWNLGQGAWVGRPHASMKQMQTTGMKASGLPGAWKYPVFSESNTAPPVTRGYGFEIHTQLDAVEFWDAGLSLQEHL